MNAFRVSFSGKTLLLVGLGSESESGSLLPFGWHGANPSASSVGASPSSFRGGSPRRL